MKNRELIIYCAWTDNCIGCRYTKECKMFTDLNGGHYPNAAHPFLDKLDKAWLESEVEVAEVTDQDLIKVCKAQDSNCDNCDYWKECKEFRKKHGSLTPADVGAKISVVKTQDNRRIMILDGEELSKK